MVLPLRLSAASCVVLVTIALMSGTQVCASSAPRAVTCNNTQKVIPAAGAQAYQTFYRGFRNSSIQAANAEEANFEVCRAASRSRGSTRERER